MTEVYLFLGPTLSAQAAGEVLDAIVLPPVTQGDVYRLTLRRPRAIGIVDGRFQDVPAVWHKEILWALAQGMPVYGSASMGALRAAELAPFGLRGVGAIFRAYRDGLLEDDDEVAVAHGDRSDGFAARSEAMVNIRHTMDAAVSAGVLGRATAERLTGLVKAEFYPLRGYPLMLELGERAGVDPAELEALRQWLPDNRIDQKRADALEMLHQISADLAAPPPAEPVTFAFEHTEFFERLRTTASEVVLDVAQGAPAEADGVRMDDLLAELRLDPDTYDQVRDRAVARSLAASDAQRTGQMPSEESVRETAARFRRERGLHAAADAQQWLAANHLDLARFTALMREEASLRRARSAVVRELSVYIGHQLRADGRYPALVGRLLAKRRFLAEQGLDDLTAKINDEQYGELVRWHFAKLDRTVPSDLVDYWQDLGYPDEVEFQRALLREYWFSTRHTNAHHSHGEDGRDATNSTANDQH